MEDRKRDLGDYGKTTKIKVTVLNRLWEQEERAFTLRTPAAGWGKSNMNGRKTVMARSKAQVKKGGCVASKTIIELF